MEHGTGSRLLAALRAALHHLEVEAHGAVGVLGDVGHLLVHQLLAVGILVVERSLGLRRVGQAVVASVGVGVAWQAGVVYLVVHLAVVFNLVHGQAVVGRYDGQSLVVVLRAEVGSSAQVVDGVHHVPCPHFLVVVNVQDEHSLAILPGIPARQLAVLQQIVFVGVGIVVDDVGFAAFAQRLHGRHLRVFLQLNGLQPSGAPLLVAAVAGRHESALVAVVGAVVHEVPRAHAEVLVGGVIHVGESQTVGELVAEGANAVDAPFGGLAGPVVEDDSRQLAAARIGVHLHAVECQGAAFGAEPVFMGPHGVLAATGSLTQSGIEHVHLVHLAVAVPVVVGKVHIAVNGLAGFTDHGFGIRVFVIRVVASIVARVVFQRHGPHHIERQVELTTALGTEVVVHAALESLFAGEARLVDNAVVECRVVALFKLLVGEFHQDDQALLLARVVVAGGTAHLLHARGCGQAALLGGALHAAHLRLAHQLLAVGLDEGRAVVPITVALGVAIEVCMLIAHEHGSDRCTVGQLNGSP